MCLFFFFDQKTAYEMRISDWSSDVCSSDLDLRNPSAVCGSNNCIYDGSVKATDCDKTGTKALYDACSTYNECAQGLACVDHPFYGPECEKWCRVGQEIGRASGRERG